MSKMKKPMSRKLVRLYAAGAANHGTARHT
jgi:hypothetical protein